VTGFPFYSGRNAARRPEGAPELPASRRAQQDRPEGYVADDGLVDAVNVALLLSQPLLLTGEPGTGKTQLAYNLAYQLRLGNPLKFETKSTSVASDLFYYYNSLARFHAAQTGEGSRQALDYITFNALGLAILLASDRADDRDLLPKDVKVEKPRRSVVLIDEVDKAPRDFPNDILNEMEGMYFRIPELDNRRVQASATMQPVLVITSNSEKNLPDAFLRRCVYYNISFPNRERLADIIAIRLGGFVKRDDPFVSDALELFQQFRSSRSGLRKKPATAELLGWLLTLRNLAPMASNPLAKMTDAVRGTLSALVKTADDQERAQEVYDAWVKEKKR
jgi:MoxR-like ATPase